MTESTSNSMLQNIRSNALNLGVMAIVAAAALAITYVLTNPMIADNQRQAQIAALQEVMPADYFDEDLLNNSFALTKPELLHQAAGSQAYVARLNGAINGWIFPVTSVNGYSGNIDLLVGIDQHGQITGVRITAHKETPGLGDKVDYKKSTWVDDFIGTNLSNRNWAVKKDGGDFDQFTGATITPRAVVDSVADSLAYFQQQRETLIKAANAKQGQAEH